MDPRYLQMSELLTVEMNCGFFTYDYEKENDQFYMLRDGNNKVVFQFSNGDNCMLCNTEMDSSIGRFTAVTAGVVVFFTVNYTRHDQKVNCLDLPKIIKVQGLSFKLICGSIVVNEKTSASHFKGIFLVEEQFHMLDDLTPINRKL